MKRHNLNRGRSDHHPPPGRHGRTGMKHNHFYQGLPSTRDLSHHCPPPGRPGSTDIKRHHFYQRLPGGGHAHHHFVSDYLQPEIYLILALLLVDAGEQA